MPDETLSDVLDLVPPRLRALRNRRGLTLAQIAADTGISVSTLSRLESGQRRPTLELLLPLAKAYRVPLDDLVGAPPTGDPRVHPKPIRKHGMIIIPLSRQAEGLRAYKMILPARKHDGPIKQGSHDGYDWMYVLSGRVRLALGRDELTLEPGEAAEFDTRTPHGFASAGGAPAEILSLVSLQGERVHVRNA